jgi:hypothetical protein
MIEIISSFLIDGLFKTIDLNLLLNHNYGEIIQVRLLFLRYFTEFLDPSD